MAGDRDGLGVSFGQRAADADIDKETMWGGRPVDNNIENGIGIQFVLPFLWSAMEFRDNPLVVYFSPRLSQNLHDRCRRSPMGASGPRTDIAFEEMEEVEPAATWLIPLSVREAAGGPRRKAQEAKA